MDYLEEKMEKKIINYLTGKATPEEIDELVRWVDESAENRRFYEQTRNIWEISNPAFEVAEDDMERAQKRLLRSIDDSKDWYIMFRLYWQRAAAILILPLIAYSIYQYNKISDYNEATITEQEILIPYGTHSSLNLPDGSIAWLNAGSRIKFPTLFKKGERVVEISGEAYFHVKADKKNPFIVKTDMVEVTATGTEFNVEAYNNEHTAVTMLNGAVKVNRLNDRENSINLEAGTRILYDKNGELSHMMSDEDPYKWCAWKDGNLIFKDDSLAYILKKIGRSYNVEIEINDPTLRNQLYRARFENESLSVILDLIKMTAPIEYRIESAKNSGIRDNKYERKRIEIYRR